jgi:hypothetical protein
VVKVFAVSSPAFRAITRPRIALAVGKVLVDAAGPE